MIKEFEQLKNWDLTTVGYYSYLDFQNLADVRSKHKCSVHSDYWWSKGIGRPYNNANVPYVYRWFDPKHKTWKGEETYQNPYWLNYRVDTYIKHSKTQPDQLYATQSETRDVASRDMILYLNLPLEYFRDDVKNTTYGEFDYKVVDKFFKEIDKFIDEPDAYSKFRNLVDEYNTKYPETKESQIVWSRNLAMNVHWSFKKHGQLNIPVIDRPYSWFEASSHTLVHACYLKLDSLKMFVKVPLSGDPKRLSDSWYFYIPPNNFSPTHYNNSEMFYMCYVDIKNEKIYSKKYPVSEFKYFSDNIKRLDKNLYEEWDRIL